MRFNILAGAGQISFPIYKVPVTGGLQPAEPAAMSDIIVAIDGETIPHDTTGKCLTALYSDVAEGRHIITVAFAIEERSYVIEYIVRAEIAGYPAVITAPNAYVSMYPETPESIYDTQLSESSKNALQNKVITAVIGTTDLQTLITKAKTIVGAINEIAPHNEGAQGDILQLGADGKPVWATPAAGTTLDEVPTEGSNNGVKSGGVWSFVGALVVFDISAYHATGGVLAKYADLAAALGTNGANVPEALRKGGMSVKFVQSSDNKYVEYFLTKNTWSASEADWEKVNLEEEVSQLGQEEALITKEMQKISSLNLLNPQALTSGYISNAGSVFESETMSYSEFIPVVGVAKIYTYTKVSSFRPFAVRFITAYDKNKNVLPEKGLNNLNDVTEFEIQPGVEYVVVSCSNSYFANGNGAVSSSVMTEFEEYIAPHYVAKRSFIEDALNAVGFTNNSISTSGNLSDGESLSLPRLNVNKSVVMSFACDISSFSEIQFGKRNSGQTLGRWWKLTANTLEFWNGARYVDYTADIFNTPFTPLNNLQIIVSKSIGCNPENPVLNSKASLTIVSNGNVWQLELAFDYPENYVEMFVASVGSMLTNCKLSAQAMDINKKIWLFGDSYLSWDASRWVYYLAKFGYADNCLINAYAGQTSTDQLPVLDTLLQVGKPQYIVWCLGMNDGADDSSPSAMWMNGVNHLISKCSELGIVPVFATIPSVPTINHEKKNAWVRNSEYRYIDFAQAVGATPEGVWYSGMLADGTHPTETGARSLFAQAMTDFAEFAMK